MDQVFNSLNSIPNQIIFSFNEEIANGMPVVNPQRKIFKLNPIENSNQYSEKNFTTRHHPFLAPSSGSTAEAFLKSRYSFNPVYIHNEPATRYAMISTLHEKTSEIKKNILRFV